MEKRYPALTKGTKFPACGALVWRAGVTRKAQEKLRNFKYILKPEKSENFPAKRESCGYVVFIWEKHYPVNKRDLGTRENFSIDILYMNAV